MVTYSRAHYVFRILGHFGQAATVFDRWSTGFRLGLIGDDVPIGMDLSPFLETVAPAIATFHAAATNKVGSNTILTELTIARVGLDGKYDPSTQQTTRRSYAPVVAGTATSIHPLNTAMVISLRTGYPRGIASNGRTYYPTTGMPVQNLDGRVSVADQTAFINGAKTMIQAINQAAASQIGTLIRVGVMGQTGKTGSARVGHVERIRCDNRLDTIERRENDQPPNYVEVTV